MPSAQAPIGESFHPCALIPIYNHKDTITETVHALRAHGLPIIIVDDGSDDATRAVLQTIAQSEPALQLIRLPRNGGKGRALTAGLIAARDAGYSHACKSMRTVSTTQAMYRVFSLKAAPIRMRLFADSRFSMKACRVHASTAVT
jgi:glycosyltransferase involved in cell wall biosynthesis